MNEKAGGALRIVLVDNNATERTLFKEVVRRLPFWVEFYDFAGCQELLSWLSINDVIPDFIFLDHRMPGMNGIDCLIELRRDRRFRKIPIIMFANNAEKDDVKHAFVEGANYYLVKPNGLDNSMRILTWLLTRDKEELAPAFDDFLLHENKFSLN